MPRDMREPSFLVLTALINGPRHGYALLADVEHLSAGRLKLKVGSLYAVLQRLEDDELIEVSGEEVVDGRLRRYYQLQAAGLARLEDEAARLARNAAQTRALLRARRQNPVRFGDVDA